MVAAMAEKRTPARVPFREAGASLVPPPKVAVAEGALGVAEPLRAPLGAWLAVRVWFLVLRRTASRRWTTPFWMITSVLKTSALMFVATTSMLWKEKETSAMRCCAL